MRAYGRLLVTGAGRFVGRHLLAALRARFPATLLIAAVRPEDGALPPLAGADRVVPFDLLEPAACSAMIAETRPDGPVHLAAQPSVAASFGDPLASWGANLMGMIALAEAVMREARHCRFVLASSAEVYGLSFHAPVPLDKTALRGLAAIRLRRSNDTEMAS